MTKHSWGFLQQHRMFHANISAHPNGYRVELLVMNEIWGTAIARSADGAMREAAGQASQRLEAGLRKVRAKILGKGSRRKGV
jgi:dsRNA-specific ribonuclease